ncbi:MAG: hypothetical protein Q8P27_02800 [Candidatus Peregrinibacteria bacterium]|nr:hypothetical protein [Candidatus Peregrinibacteria bacterium]
MTTDSFQSRLSELLRSIEVDMGSTNMGFIVMESFELAVQDLRGRNLHEFFQQLFHLTQFINNTDPKFAILIDIFHDILKLAYEEDILHKQANFPLKKQKFLKRLGELIHEKREEERRIVENAMKKINVHGKGILLHDNSRTVHRVLNGFHKAGQKFTIIVAEQDPDKSGPIIEALHKKKYPFRVVPSYMVSHLADCIDMVFIGGLTLKSTMDFVMDPGTHALVSQFHLIKRPIYAFMATSKFSMWNSKKRTEVYSHVHQRRHHCKPIDFERVKFSHDRIPVKLFKRVITEQGWFTPKEMEKVYNEKLKAYLASDKKFQKILGKIE